MVPGLGRDGVPLSFRALGPQLCKALLVSHSGLQRCVSRVCGQPEAFLEALTHLSETPLDQSFGIPIKVPQEAKRRP